MFVPQDGQEYCYHDFDDSRIYVTVWMERDIDYERLYVHNCFETVNEALNGKWEIKKRMKEFRSLCLYLKKTEENKKEAV